MRQHIEIVLPVWNEELSISPLVEELDRVTADLKAQYRFSYLFVNDGSTDGTRSLLQALCDQRDDIRAIHLIHNFGHAAAIRCGLAHTAADAVVLMDADLQDSPEALPQMLDCWSCGAKTVVAERGRREGKHSWLFGLFYFLLNRLAPGHPPFGTYCLMDRSVVERLRALPENSRYFPALVCYASESIATVRVDRQARQHGRSRVGGMGLLNLAITAFLNASDFPIRLATLLGLCCATAALAAMGAAGGFALWSDAAVPGWVPVLVAVVFLGGVQLMSLGILGEYVVRIYQEVKQRPPYFVDSTERVQYRQKAA